MADDPHEEWDVVAELTEEENFERLIGRYTEYVTEGGVDVYYDEPEADLDDYIERYLRDPPAHLVSTDEETIVSFAADAYVAAATARTDRITEAKSYRLCIAFIASQRLMLDLVLSHLGPEAIPQTRAFTRRELARHLYLLYRWREPWISLIESEFPGDPLTAADLEEFEAGRVSRRAESEARRDSSRAVKDEMEELLLAHGYVVSPQDELLLVSGIIFPYSRMQEDESRRTHRYLLQERMSAEEAVRSKSPEPDHPAWRFFLDHYFPIPE